MVNGCHEDDARVAELVAPFASALLQRGFDLAAPLNLRLYNAGVPESCRIEAFGREDALGVVVASSRIVWKFFLAALRERPELVENPHPFDMFAMETILEAARAVPVASTMRWSHDPPPRRIAIQRAAELAGLARLGRTHLSIHPVHGPWIGLRAIAVFDSPGPRVAPPALPDPCTDCAVRCDPLLERAVAAARADEDLAETPRASWKLWVEMRDACPVGHNSRYHDDQIRYHYTKDLSFLRSLVTSVPS